MAIYFSTFISGFSDLIEEILKKQFQDVKINSLLDGLVIFETSAPQEKIKSLKYFNNSFILLSRVETTPETSNASIVKKLYQDTHFKNIRKYILYNRKHSFRTIISRENQLTSINNEIIRKIEHKIQLETGLSVNRQNADYEIWFLIRKEGCAFLGIRITKLKKDYAKGELRQELAHLLCLLSEPQREDIFLDPFAGVGAITQELAINFPYKKITTGERDPKSLTILRQRLLKKRGVFIEHLDALNLKSIESKSIDKIITDPPWGFYKQQKTDFNWFYTKMLTEFIRVTKSGGIIIILTGKKDVFENVINSLKDKATLLKKYDILVSGKKAGAYKLSPIV